MVDTYTVDEFLRAKLLAKGPEHTGYYHYTRWPNLESMLRPSAENRVMWLSRADCTNDGIESLWGNRVYMLCFSYTRYEDVAMWMNYGKRCKDAVRVRFDGRDVQDWYSALVEDPAAHVWALDGQGRTQKDRPLEIESVRLGDVAYVLPTRLLFENQPGNVDYRRTYYHVVRDGKTDWADGVFGNSFSDGIEPFFKKRGWGYEREVRLVVKLREPLLDVERLAVDFSLPLGGLEKRMAGRRRPGGLFPELMSGPWYDESFSVEPICGVSMRDVERSDYHREIRIFDPGTSSVG